MSFSSDCKEELIRIRVKNPAQRLSQISGLTFSAGGLRISRNPALFYHTENVNVARHIVSMVTSLYDVDAVIEAKRLEHRRAPYYEVCFSEGEIKKLLNDTGAITDSESGMQFMTEFPSVVFEDEENGRAFLRGCFLGSGSCVDPKRGYHLEMIFHSRVVSERTCELLRSFFVSARMTVRKSGRYVVYLKEGDDVSGMLALVGANVSAMELENVRVEKDMRNYINRTSNCETANLDKQVVASLRQQSAIAKIDRCMGLSALPPSLREAADLRMRHPDATVQELADLAEIQKSGMYHRLERLMKMAEGLKEE